MRRQKRTDLEEMVSKCVVEAVMDTTPGLRDAIRTALDKGAKPADLRKRYGARGQRRASTTAQAIEWLIDEWERDKGKIAADESIDRIC